MYSRQYKTRKTSSKSSDTPASNPLELRRFVVQPRPQTPDLQAQEEKLAQSDSLLRNISILPPDGQRSPSPIQMKLTIGKVGDKYEQEADRVAADVVQRINAPENFPVQHQELAQDEDELQMKPLTDAIQRQETPEDEDELQMKPIVQRQSVASGMAATPDLEESIQGLRGSGQPLAKSIREPMEQAFGADFSGVKVHTDTQSDQLNKSIQAKAFTTGQDIFFRQGTYNPGSSGGQELIAHELTHVVQQTGGMVRRSQLGVHRQLPNTYITSDALIQRLTDEDISDKKDKKHKKNIQDKYNKSLGLRTPLYHYREEDFDYYFKIALSLEDLENLIDNAIKKAEAKKEAADTTPIETADPEQPKADVISPPVSTTLIGSQQKKKKKKQPTRLDITAQVLTGGSATKQEPVPVKQNATNTLIQGWIKNKPVGATITPGIISVSEDTVYIYATVTIPDTTVTEYPQLNVYDIETHYHPVPTSNNYLHVKRSAGSDAGNVVTADCWLIPGGKKTLVQAVTKWDSTNPENKSPHNWG